MTTKKRELKAAKQFNATRQLRSGAGNFTGEKEDFYSDTFLFQHKETKGKTHTVKKMDLNELKKNSIDMGKNPAYVIQWEDETWVMVPKIIFETIEEYLGPTDDS